MKIKESRFRFETILSEGENCFHRMHFFIFCTEHIPLITLPLHEVYAYCINNRIRHLALYSCFRKQSLCTLCWSRRYLTILFRIIQSFEFIRAYLVIKYYERTLFLFRIIQTMTYLSARKHRFYCSVNILFVSAMFGKNNFI